MKLFRLKMPSGFWGKARCWENPRRSTSENTSTVAVTWIGSLSAQPLLLKKLPAGERPGSSALQSFSAC